jgi:hypothetical protein
MTRCKRNTLFVFGFLIVLTVIFVPYKRESYVTGDTVEARIPEKYGDPGEGTAGILVTQQMDQKGLKFFPFFVSGAIQHHKFIEWKDRTVEEGERIRAGKNVLENKDIYYLEREFYKKYDGLFIYDKFWLEFYLTEILIIIFMVGFSYILFCVLLRKKKKVIRYRSSRSPK